MISRASSRRYLGGCLAALLILSGLAPLSQILFALGSNSAQCCRVKHSCCHRPASNAGSSGARWTGSSPCGSNCPRLAALANPESGALLSGARGMAYRPPRFFAVHGPANPADVSFPERPPLYQRPPPPAC